MRLHWALAIVAVLAAMTMTSTATAAESNNGLTQAVPAGDPNVVSTPGTDAQLIEQIKRSMPAPEGTQVGEQAVSPQNSEPVPTTGALPLAGGLVPLAGATSTRHSCCFGAPAPIYLGEITAQNANSFGRCLFTAVTDTPRAKYGNFRDISYGMSMDCPHSWLQGTGQARLMDAGNPADAFCCHLGWAPQFWFDGGTGWGLNGYTRHSDTQTQFIAGWFDITVDDTSNSAGFSSAAGSNHGMTCEGLLAKRLRCWFYTQPFAFVPDVVDPTQCREGICDTVNDLTAEAVRLANDAYAGLAEEYLHDATTPPAEPATGVDELDDEIGYEMGSWTAIPGDLAQQVQAGTLSRRRAIEISAASARPPVHCNAKISQKVGDVVHVYPDEPDRDFRAVHWTVRHTCWGLPALYFRGNPDLRHADNSSILFSYGSPYATGIGSDVDTFIRLKRKSKWLEPVPPRRPKRVVWYSDIEVPKPYQWLNDAPFGDLSGINEEKTSCRRVTNVQDGEGPKYLNVLKCKIVGFRFK